MDVSYSQMFFLASLYVFAYIIGVHSNINCIRRACIEGDSLIVCNQSLILISDVTNLRLERDDVAFENMKRICMGRGYCNSSRVCNYEHHRSLVVHYFCVDVTHFRHNTCSRQISELSGDFGYIQSPDYPAATSSHKPCRWRIEPANGSLVVLSLHDVATHGTKEHCDGGLVVSGRACEGQGHSFAPTLLCGGEHPQSLVRCGQVDIQLTSSKKVYPLRFWLSFHVHSRDKPTNFQASLLPCSGWMDSMDTGLPHGRRGNVKTDPTTHRPMVSEENNTEILVVMLSVISGVSAVLLVILVVVCVRCRYLHGANQEHVYSEPSPGLQAHYEYMTALEAQKPRPQLADGYFEVADALPHCQRREQPASPPYAEVEQFTHIHKVKLVHPDYEDVCNTRAPSPDSGKTLCVTETRNENRSSPKASGNDSHKSAKRGVLGRLKAEKPKAGGRDRKNCEDTVTERKENSGSKNGKQLQASTSSSATQKTEYDRYQGDPCSQDCSVDEDDQTMYEQIGEFVPPSKRTQPLKGKAYIMDVPYSGQRSPMKNAEVETEKHMAVKKDSPRRNRERNIPKGTTHSEAVMKTDVNKITKDNNNSAARSTLIGHKHGIKALEKTRDSSASNRPVVKGKLARERPAPVGIVKNGIKKFEQNGAAL